MKRTNTGKKREFGIRISKDGKSQAIDNVIVDRFF